MTALLQELVTTEAGRHPDAEAVSAPGHGVSYRELDNWSNQLARVLRHQGCRRGDRVCVIAPPSAQAVVAMLGALKADAIYVPLNPATPPARLLEIAWTCEAACILATEDAIPAIDGLVRAGALSDSVSIGALGWSRFAGQAFAAQFSFTEVLRESSRGVASRNRGGSPAYLVFPAQSGSPGVAGTHAGAIRFLQWAVGHLDIRAGDRHPLHARVAQDWSIFQVFSALAGGATLCEAPEMSDRSMYQLAKYIRRSGLTHWSSSSEILDALAAEDLLSPGDFPALRHVVWWGSPLGRRTLQYWRTRLGRVQFTALFGAREATMASAYSTVGQGPVALPLPVGTPFPGHEVLLLDEECQPLEIGETGEILVRGLGLTPGYWRAPATVGAQLYEQPGRLATRDRVYRTGTLGRRGPDGQIYVVDQTAEGRS